MHVFYDEHISSEMTHFELCEEESRHVCKVLRLINGDKLILLNGQGGEFTCEITDSDSKKCVIRIMNVITHKKPNYDIHIAIAPTKNNERIEWFLEKATEIGITTISFLQCQNNERTRIKLDRFQKILIAAMKQSKRFFLPQLNNLIHLKDFLSMHQGAFIAYCGNGDKSLLIGQETFHNAPILIGPEGDFTKEEIALALKYGYKLITLGENRLRTETAGLVACMQTKMNIDLRLKK